MDGLLEGYNITASCLSVGGGKTEGTTTAGVQAAEEAKGVSRQSGQPAKQLGERDHLVREKITWHWSWCVCAHTNV